MSALESQGKLVYYPAHDRFAEDQEHEGVEGHDHKGTREGGRDLYRDHLRHRARPAATDGDDPRQDREGPRCRGEGLLLLDLPPPEFLLDLFAHLGPTGSVSEDHG